MAIAASDLVWTFPNGQVVPQGSLHAVFIAGRVGGATEYEYLDVRNLHATLTLSAVKAWLLDAGGGATVAIALADASAIATTGTWPALDPTGLSYSSPASKTAGIALPNLAPKTKARIAVRRTLTAASEAYPEVTRLKTGGSSPL